MNTNNTPAHGTVGLREQAFTQLLPLRANAYAPSELMALAESMKSAPDSVKDNGDPEENLLMPAGYTYFGQFIDHDLTFDSTSSLDPNSSAQATNLRTPRFDLDCLYGDGPDAQPFMYDATGTKLLYTHKPLGQDLAGEDLLRTTIEDGGRAIIGDKRNDENSIICQIQLAFVKYHNAVVDELAHTRNLTGNSLFLAARNEVRWAYQKLVIEDFLPRIVNKDVLENLAHSKSKVSERAKNYALYTHDKRGSLPLEFVGAAYRFGHSGVRTGYRLNSSVRTNNTPTGRFSIFPASTDDSKTESLLGFDPLPINQVIDHWERFFPDDLPNQFPEQGLLPKAKDKKEIGDVRLQYAYKIDTSIVDPLGALPRKQVAGEETTLAAEALVKERLDRPSLALLNLLRGNAYRISSGQSVARALIAKGFPCEVLDPKYLCVRQKTEDEGFLKFVPISSVFFEDTPLWFYILAEAQKNLVDTFGIDKPFEEDELLKTDNAKTQLGWVGGRIVAEVFYGLLDSDPESYFNKAPNEWTPLLDGNKVIFLNLLKFKSPKPKE